MHDVEVEFERAYKARMAEIDRAVKHYEKEAEDYLKQF